MPKKHHEEEHGGNHERWLLTYADMITLLMIFFIVMYSMSQVDKAKFAAVAQELSIVMGGGSKTVLTDPGSGILKDTPPQNPNAQMDEAQKNLEEYIVQNGLGTMAKIYRDERGMIISLNEGLLFELGSAEIDKQSKEILAKITNSVKPMPNFVRVEGFTDNIPIKTARFNSNWELASQRAINVAKIMMDNGLAGERISTVSYGEYRPMYPNDSNEHRKQNRKVDIIVINQENNKLEPKVNEKQVNE